MRVLTRLLLLIALAALPVLVVQLSIAMVLPWTVPAMAAALTALILAWWAGWILVQRPLRTLLGATERWRAGDFSTRIGAVRGWPAFNALARSCNAMAEALEQRQEAQERAHALALRMAQVFDSITDSVLEVDRDWRVTFANVRAMDQVGNGGALVGMRLWEIFPHSESSPDWGQCHRAMAEQVPVQFESPCARLGKTFMVRVFPSRNGLAVYLQDVTEGQAARQQAERAEARYRAIVQTAVDAMVVIDEAGIIQSFNPAAERIFGYGEAEVIGANIAILMTADHAGHHDDYIAAYRNTGVRKIIGIGREVDGRHRDGHVVPLDLSIAEWRVGGQRFFTGIMRDISSRRQAAEMQAQQTRRLQLMADMAGALLSAEEPEAVLDRFFTAASLDLGLDVCFSYVADDASRCLTLTYGAGVPQETHALLARIGYGDYICGQVAATLAPMFLSNLQDSTEPSAEPARDIGLTAYAGYPLIGTDGRLLGVLGLGSRRVQSFSAEDRHLFSTVASNLTAVRERLRAETALNERGERLSLALSAARAGTWDWNIVSNRNRWSPEYHDLLGTDPSVEPPQGLDWTGLVHVSDRDGVLTQLRTVLAQRQSTFHVEFRIEHPRRGLRWLAGTGRVFYAGDGSPLRLTGIVIDVTERNRWEVQLQQAKEEAERANLSKTKFLAAASHDLRQPVQSLVLFAGTLADRLHGRPEGVLVDHMQKATDALKQLLDGLLDMSRLDAGVVTPKIGNFSLKPLLEQLAAEYEPRAAQKGLRLRILPSRAWVRSDPMLLERMLRNLIENAIRYTERGSVLVGCRRRQGQMRLQVIDTGIGIPLARQREIFEEFVQVGNTERDRAQGLGLGLAIVRRLSALMEHPLALQSRPGLGTCFTVEVPRVAPPAGRVASLPTAKEDRARRGTVLVVDDETIILMGLQSMLESWGFRVIAATGEQQALERLQAAATTPDLILADYRLRQGQIGPEVVRSVHNLCGRTIPAVILTGDTDPARIAEVERCGFGILHKPVTARELRRVVEAAVPDRLGTAAVV